MFKFRNFCILVFVFTLPFLNSCNQKKEEFGNAQSYDTSSSCALDLSSTTQTDLLIIRINWNDYKFNSNAQTWSNTIFGNCEGQQNHFWYKNSHGKSAFRKAQEIDATGGGSANDGIITVSLNYNHPNPYTYLNQERWKDQIFNKKSETKTLRGNLPF